MVSKIGVLANARHAQELKEYEQMAIDQREDKARRSGMPVAEDNPLAEDPRLAQVMRPQGSPQEYEARFQENKSWLSDPKTQAALLGFAINIMQPLGGNGGPAEFVGALGQSLGAGAASAAGVEMAEQEQLDAQRANDLAERKMQVEERGVGLSARELDLRERQLLQSGQANKFSKVISGNDALNQQLGLGIPPGMSARVVITYDQKGNPIAGSVEGEFGDAPKGLGGDAKNIVDLFDAADQAEMEGKPQEAKVLRDRARQLSQEFSLGTGEMIDWGDGQVPAGTEPSIDFLDTGRSDAQTGNLSPSGTQTIPQTGTQAQAPTAPVGIAPPRTSGTEQIFGPKVVPIPGGKVDREQKAQEAQEQTKIGDGLAKSAMVNGAINQIRTTLAEANFPPDWTITGGIGQLMSQDWFPVSNNAQVVAQQLGILKANVGFDALQAMRESSPTGGALGPVSDTENKLLQSTLVSLNQFQGGRDKLEESLLTLQYLFDPEAMNDRQTIAKAIQDGKVSEAQGLTEIQKQLDEYIYPPDLTSEVPFDLGTAPDYVSPEAKEFWDTMEPASKLLFLNENDRKRAVGN